MSKYIWSAAVVGLIVLTASQEASAGRRHWRRRRSFWHAQPAVVAPAPVYSAPPKPVPQTGGTAQAPNGGYRSYSYDPTPVYQAPAAPTYRQLPPSERRFYRADRKAHGLSWYENQW